MKNIEERISYLENAIKILRAYKGKDSNEEVNRIITICDYNDELEALEAIKKANKSLF